MHRVYRQLSTSYLALSTRRNFFFGLRNKILSPINDGSNLLLLLLLLTFAAAAAVAAAVAAAAAAAAARARAGAAAAALQYSSLLKPADPKRELIRG